MTLKTSITKSRSGHYTVVIRRPGRLTWEAYRGKIGSLHEAREIAKQMLQTLRDR